MKPKIKTTCTKLQLQLLSFCLLCLSGKTRCDGNGPAVVTVEQDSDAVLPCSLSSKEDIEFDRFDWKKPAQIDGGQKEVFYYDAGIHYNNGYPGQSEEFKGRVSHFPEELKHGNASIIIRNTMVTDSGDYTCDFPDLQPRQTFHIKLVVGGVLKDRTDENTPGATSKPNIRTLDETNNRALLQCEVHGNPQPEVEWRDSAGNKLPAEEPQVSERHGRFYVTLNTAVTKTDRYRCVATQKDISHQIYAETFVHITEPVVVTVKLDEDALLPCSLRTNKNIEQGYFDWNKFVQHNERQKEVFLYDKGRHSPNFGSQDEEFKGRVSHFPQELKHGNASIIIRNTKMADSGDYTCTFTEPRKTFHIKLVVAKKPSITTLEQTKDWSRLQCEVQGASSKPKVEWKDSSGNILPAEPQVTDRGGSYDIILQTTVTKTDLYRCVVTQEEIKHQAEAKIHVYISGPAVVTVEQGRDAVLPCSLSSKNIEFHLFDWKKPAQIDGGQKEVFYYDAGIHYNNGRAGQSEEFKGRVSHFPEELKHGNAAIIIRNTMVADSGNYTCVFPNLQPPQTFHIKLVVEPVVVIVEQDGNALLPCSLRTKENIEQEYFYWYKVPQNNEKQKEVFLYEKGKHSPSFGSQDDGFKGRVSHFQEELKHGNASIIIRNTNMADSGDYTCTFPERQPFHIKLVVGAAPKPNIRTLIETDNSRLLQCEANGHPQPEVEWRDSAGNKLPAEEPQVTEKDGRFYVTLNTTVTKTGNYRCVATQKNISHQIHDETSVRMNAKKPSITTLEQTKDWSRLQCEVQGASPKPKVEWKDSSGNILPAEKPQVTVRGGSYDIILQTTVTKTDYYHCVVTQEEINHQTEAKILVYISGPTVISVYKGDALTLPCSLSTKKNIESEMFEWKKDGQKEVFLYDAGTINGRSGQREEFKGRVFHFPDNLKHGDASITIRNTELTDSGNYTCDFPRLQPRPTFHIKLVVTGNSGSGANSSGSTGRTVVVSVFCTLLVGGGFLAVLVYKGYITLNCKKGSPADEKEGSAVPLKSQPSRSQEAPDPET